MGPFDSEELDGKVKVPLLFDRERPCFGTRYRAVAAWYSIFRVPSAVSGVPAVAANLRRRQQLLLSYRSLLIAAVSSRRWGRGGKSLFSRAHCIEARLSRLLE